MAAAGGGSLHRSTTNVYRRLLNFDSPLAVIGLDNVVPKGEEKLLKTSFYQAATMFILALGLAGVYSLYLILSPFVKPILWAVLIGTVLHPLKLTITHMVRTWLLDIGSSSAVPILSFHIATSPMTLTFSLLTYVRAKVTKFIIPLLAASFIILLLCATIRYDFRFISNIFAIQTSVFSIFGAIWNIVILPWPVYLTAFLGYTIAAIVLPPNVWHQTLLRAMSLIWWALLFVLVSKLLGPFSLLLFFALLIPIFVKAASHYLKTSEGSETDTAKLAKQPSIRSLQRASEFIAALSPRFSHLATIELKRALYKKRNGSDSEKDKIKKGEESKPANVIIMATVWAVILVKLLSYPFLVTFLAPFLLLPPLLCYVAKSEQVDRLTCSAISLASKWFETRRAAFLPPPAAKLGKYLVKGDAKIRKMFDSCVEGVVTAILIIGVVALFLFTIFVAAVQLHRESVYVFTMTNELLNRTLHPEVNRWLENNDMNVSALHDLATNAANFGRQFFNSTVDSWIHSVPDPHREPLKLQLLNAYDLMSNKFFESWTHDLGYTLHTHVESESEEETSSFSSLFSGWFDLNFTGMMEIGVSVWAVLKENAGLFLAIFSHIASALLICSWAVFGYAVSSVVFLTTLYYLLMASGDTYKPVQILISLTPFDDNEGNGSNIVGRAVDSGIRGVFIATFKMILFYGLYTWFLHSVFEIGIVFLPSLCAAVLAAVPIVGAYWASLPGVFQLWLIADRGLAALLFFGLHMLPIYFVDVIIYSDIKGGGHPYLTGLAIVGGVSCLGFEGAILGPVLLCLIVILMNLYRGVLHANNNTTTESSNGSNTQVTNEVNTSQQGGPTPSIHQTSRRLQGKTLVVSTDLISSMPLTSNVALGSSTTSLPEQTKSDKAESVSATEE